MRLLAALFVALLSTLISVPASAQVLPPGWAACQAHGAVQPFQYGQSQVYNQCSSPSGAEEYGRVFVSFVPPANLGLQAVKASRRPSVWQRIRRFFLPGTQSGTMILALTLIQDGTEIPLDLIPLASFTINEHDGLTVNDQLQTQSNDVGYRFRVTPTTRVKARFFITFSSETTPQIVARIRQVSDIAGGFGYLPAAGFSQALAPIGDLERDIVHQANFDRRSLRETPMAFEQAGDTAVLHQLRLADGEALTGSLFVGIRRDLSIFQIPAAHPAVTAGQINFHLTGFGDAQTGPVTRGLIKGDALNTSVSRLMGSNFGVLSTSDPGQFQVACSALETALQDDSLNLATQDRVLAMWAFLAPKQNVRIPAIRDQDCLSNELSSFELFGLSLPPVRVQMPSDYEAVLQSATEQANHARETAAAADAMRIQAINYANSAQTAGAQSGLVVQNLPSRRYAGQAPSAMNTFVGQLINRDSSGAPRDNYMGQFRLAPPDIPLYHGRGVYEYTSGDNIAARRQYAGDLADNYFSGLGQMTFTDGRQFVGQFAGDLPNGLGVMTFNDGRTLTGSFRDGVIDGRGIEQLPDGTLRWGNYVNGVIPGGH